MISVSSTKFRLWFPGASVFSKSSMSESWKRSVPLLSVTCGQLCSVSAHYMRNCKALKHAVRQRRFAVEPCICICYKTRGFLFYFITIGRINLHFLDVVCVCVCTYAQCVYADLAVAWWRHLLAHILKKVRLTVSQDAPKGVAKFTWNVWKKRKKMFQECLKETQETVSKFLQTIWLYQFIYFLVHKCISNQKIRT